MEPDQKPNQQYVLGMKVGAAPPEQAPATALPLAKNAEYIAAVVSPFATGAAILIFVLSLLEFLRPRFVSLFLDLRLVGLVAVVLWAVSAASVTERRGRKFSAFLISLIAVACVPILYELILPFGRLGLITLAAGVMVLLMAVLACMIKPLASDR